MAYICSKESPLVNVVAYCLVCVSSGGCEVQSRFNWCPPCLCDNPVESGTDWGTHRDRNPSSTYCRALSSSPSLSLSLCLPTPTQDFICLPVSLSLYLFFSLSLSLSQSLIISQYPSVFSPSLPRHPLFQSLPVSPSLSSLFISPSVVWFFCLMYVLDRVSGACNDHSSTRSTCWHTHVHTLTHGRMQPHTHTTEFYSSSVFLSV